MNCLILGGDKRYLEIINDFVKKGYGVDIVGYKDKIDGTKKIEYNEININKYDLILLPVNGVSNNFVIKAQEEFQIDINFFDNVKKDCLIFSGINSKCLNEMISRSKLNVTFLMSDKNVIKENAISTVEGIISDIIVNTDITINNSKIMVIGYGNIGSYLVDILKGLNAEVYASIIDEKDKQTLNKKQIKHVFSSNENEMQKILPSMDIIINTVPSLVLNDNYINYIKKSCYVLDISSYPHGIDQKYLNEQNIKNKIYLGIPSIVAPKTAGKTLLKKINYIVGGN